MAWADLCPFTAYADSHNVDQMQVIVIRNLTMFTKYDLFLLCYCDSQSNIGLILHGQREFKISEKFLEKALDVQLK